MRKLQFPDLIGLFQRRSSPPPSDAPAPIRLSLATALVARVYLNPAAPWIDAVLSYPGIFMPSQKWWVVALIVCCGALQASAQPKPVQFLLASQQPLPYPKLTLAQIAEQYPAFKHKPFSTGFNAMVMPFHYTDQTSNSAGDPAEAIALSFLLSNDLDWSPACYCARHAYFVFRADHDLYESLKDQYDPAEVTKLVARWHATHAVGGSITRSDHGYTGKLEIYDRAGRCISTTSFDTPESYFDLLGEMSTSAMKFLGPAPCDELVQHLHIQRCKDPRSIVLLGNAPEESDRPTEIRAFEHILEGDPGFADVRYWVANQGAWLGFTTEQATRERCLALDSYLVAQALRPHFLEPVPPEFSAKNDQWIKQAARYWGESSSAGAEALLSLSLMQHRVPREGVAAMIKACGDYPNDYVALSRLARVVGDPSAGAPDGEMMASCCLAALQARYEPGSGEKIEESVRAAVTMQVQGRSDLASRTLVTAGWTRHESTLSNMLAALDDMGEYRTALATYEKYATSVQFTRSEAGVLAGIAAALSGQREELLAIMKDQRAILEPRGMLPLLQAYADAMVAQPVDPESLARAYKTDDGWVSWMYLMFLSQYDLSEGQSLFMDDVKTEASSAPGERPAWILLDAYDRQKSQPDLADFYRSLHWLYPDDPFVKTAFTDWANRHPDLAQARPDVSAVTAALAAFPAARWTVQGVKATPDQIKAVKSKCTPWNTCAAIADLVDRKQYDAARDLALRYANFAWQTRPLDLPLWADHLPFKIAESIVQAGN
jgi:hypothetical protein